MSLDKYVDAKVDEIADWTNSQGLRDEVVLMVKEAMRDQRHGCAESVMRKCERWTFRGDYVIELNQAHQAVMNAEPKGP